MKGSELRAQGFAVASSIVVGASLVVFGFSQPQTPAPQPPPPPTFRTEANYVRVDVFPTKAATNG
jgi:hypothetical protein